MPTIKTEIAAPSVEDLKKIINNYGNAMFELGRKSVYWEASEADFKSCKEAKTVREERNKGREALNALEAFYNAYQAESKRNRYNLPKAF